MTNNYSEIIEIIPDEFYWAPYNITVELKTYDVFDCANRYEYNGFQSEFGPMDLGQIYDFSKQLDLKRKHKQQNYEKSVGAYQINKLIVPHKKLIQQLGNHNGKKNTNGIFQVCCYLMLVEGYKPKEAISKFASVKTNLVTYGENNPTPQMSISDMLCGFQIGLDKNWFSYKNFDAKNYEYRSSVRGGDMNWIVPNVILAFSSPVDKPEVKTINKSFKVFNDLKSLKIQNM